MRGFYDRILVVSADWENPAPEIPVSEWKCEFTEEGREGRGGGGREIGSSILTSGLDPHSTAFSIISILDT